MQLQWRTNFQHYFLGWEVRLELKAGKRAAGSSFSIFLTEIMPVSGKYLMHIWSNNLWITTLTLFKFLSSFSLHWFIWLFSTLLCSLENFLLSLWENISGYFWIVSIVTEIPSGSCIYTICWQFKIAGTGYPFLYYSHNFELNASFSVAGGGKCLRKCNRIEWVKTCVK